MAASAEKQPSAAESAVRAPVDWVGVLRSPATIYGALLLGCFVLVFWPLMKRFPEHWFSSDTYYAHGSLVPLCAAFIVYDRWDRIKRIPVAGSWLALIPIAGLLYVTWIATRTPRQLMFSILLILTIMCVVWLVAGLRWLWALLGPILYLAFGLPVWQSVIDRYTIPLQDMSTNAAFAMLKLGQLHPYRANDTTIMLDNFELFIGVPCSGLKLVLAVVAITVFFIMIARLSFWANLVLAATTLPLCLAVNGLRIALIGVVGNSFGATAGHQFHDYSGYIALAVCFAVLYKLTKVLGWKS